MTRERTPLLMKHLRLMGPNCYLRFRLELPVLPERLEKREQRGPRELPERLERKEPRELQERLERKGLRELQERLERKEPQGLLEPLEKKGLREPQELPETQGPQVRQALQETPQGVHVLRR